MTTTDDQPAADASDRDADRRSILQSVRIPAVFLASAGLVGGAGVIASITLLLLASMDDPSPEAPMVRAVLGVMAVLFALLSGLAFAGGVAAWRGRGHNLARAGAIAAICSIHTTFLGMAIGIWNIVMLNRPGVREAFEGAPLPEASAPERSLPAAPRPQPRPLTAADDVGASGPSHADGAPPHDVLQGVRLPGALMTGAGVLGALMWTLIAVSPSRPDDPAGEVLGRILAVMLVLVSVVLIAAGLSMFRGRRHTLAVIGAILSCITCVCALPGIPLGIWAFVQLNRPGVREAFDQNR